LEQSLCRAAGVDEEDQILQVVAINNFLRVLLKGMSVKMNFNFKTIFTHFHPTCDQLKAALQDFWKKNEENETEIARLQQKDVASQGEISRLRQENNDHEKKISFLNHEYGKINEQSNKIAEIEGKNVELERKNAELERKNVELERKNAELERKNAELERKNDELRRKNVPIVRNKLLYSDLERKHTELKKMYSKLTNEKNDLENKIEEQKPSCPVCMQKFDTEECQPYALSCPHIVCAQCLHPALETDELRQLNLWAQLMHDNPIGLAERHPSKRCPICRIQVTTQLKKICLQS